MLLPPYLRIAHLAGSRPKSGDLILDERETARVFRSPVQVFEKLDGTNVGIRFERGRRLLVTPRSLGERTPVALPDRYGMLAAWAVRRLPSLWAMLGAGLEAYGEWLGERRRSYREAPDEILFFDILDVRRRRFLERPEATRLLRRHGFHPNPMLFRGRIAGVAQLPEVGLPSRLGCPRPEGWIVEAAGARYKLVRPERARRR